MASINFSSYYADLFKKMIEDEFTNALKGASNGISRQPSGQGNGNPAQAPGPGTGGVYPIAGGIYAIGYGHTHPDPESPGTRLTADDVQPLRTGERLAHRAWRATYREDVRAWRLRALSQWTLWQPGIVMVGRPSVRDEGIYCYASLDNLLGCDLLTSSSDPIILGTVDIWGETHVFDLGFRAEFAAVRTLDTVHSAPHTHPGPDQLLDELRDIYITDEPAKYPDPFPDFAEQDETYRRSDALKRFNARVQELYQENLAILRKDLKMRYAMEPLTFDAMTRDLYERRAHDLDSEASRRALAQTIREFGPNPGVMLPYPSMAVRGIAYID